MKTNNAIAKAQGAEASANSVKFEVGATYEFYGSPVIKVKSRTEKTADVYNYLEYKHEKKRIYVREDGVEYINLPNTGVYTISAERKKVQEEYKEELSHTLREMYEHLYEAASLGSDADCIFHDLGEENEDIVYITSTLYDVADMLQNFVKQQKVA